MGLFGGSGNTQQPTRLFGMPIQTSILGKPVPIVYGMNRLAGEVIWYGDWRSRNASGGGKFGSGKGASGKSGGNQYNYSAAVAIGICQGPVQGINSIWLDKARLIISQVTEVVTAASTVTPTLYSTGYRGAIGVAARNPTSRTVNDFGSPGTLTLSSPNNKQPFVLVSGTPAAGQYSLSSAVSAINVTVAGKGYNPSSLPSVTVAPPPGAGVTATATCIALLSTGVWIIIVNNPGSGYDPLHPPAVTIAAPPGGGQQAFAVANLIDIYNFNAADVGRTVELTYKFFQVTTSETQGQVVPQQNLALDLFTGTPGQAAWPYLTANHLLQAVGYTSLAYVANENMDLGSGGLVSNYSYELAGFAPFSPVPLTTTLNNSGGAIMDAEPSVVMYDFLTASKYGAGLLPTEIGDLTEMRTYCVANGLFISPVIDSQRAAREWVGEWLTVANSEAVWSDGVLKIRCYGDKSATGNNVDYNPNTTPIYDIDDDAYLLTQPSDPLQVIRPSVRDAENQVTVEWANRANNYNLEPIVETDDWSVRKYGLKPKSPESLHCITLPTVAQKVATTILRRSVYIRNQYTTKLDAIKYALLEPMDLVTVNDTALGLVRHPVRILTLEEDDNLNLSFTGEDFPWSAASPTAFPKQTISGAGPGIFDNPGPVNLVQFVELPIEVTQGSEYALGIGLTGGSSWGGAEVFVSTDGGNSYHSVGKQVGVSAIGVTTASLASNSDPDNTHTLSVDLSASGGGTANNGTLPSYSVGQKDAFFSLVAVEDELISYQTATPTSSFHYDITALRRGVYDTDYKAHPSGAPFCVINQASLFVWDYDQSVVGTTVFFKFCSFNNAGQRQESIDKVTAYSQFVKGPRLPYPWHAGIQQPIPAEALFPKTTYSIQPKYVTLHDGSIDVQVPVNGNLPINSFSKAIGTPAIVSIVNNTTGGFIVPGTYVVGVHAWDVAQPPAAGVTLKRSELSALYVMTVPAGTNTNAWDITIAWPAGSFGGNLYIGLIDASQGLQFEDWPAIEAGTSTTGTVTYSGTGIGGTAFKGPVTGLFNGCPDRQADHIEFEVIENKHAGVWGSLGYPIGPNGIKIVGAAFTVGQFVGTYLTLLAYNDTSRLIPVMDMYVSANTADLITVAPVPGSGATLPDLRTNAPDGKPWVEFATVGAPAGLSVFVMRAQATAATANTIQDTRFRNALTGTLGAGLATDAEIGNQVFIIFGKGAGQMRNIQANTADTLTVSPDWDVVPDTTSVFVILKPNPRDTLNTLSTELATYAGSSSLVATLETTNFAAVTNPSPNSPGGTVMILAYTTNEIGERSLYPAFREMYLAGATGIAGGATGITINNNPVNF